MRTYIKYIIILISLCASQQAISDPIITIAQARTLENGALAKMTGIVTSDAILDDRSRYFQDATGGYAIFAPNNPSLVALQPGDSIVVEGEVSVFNNLQQLIDNGGKLVITVVAKGKPLPMPIKLSMDDFNGTDDKYESMLITIEDVTFKAAGNVFSGGTSGMSYDFVKGEPEKKGILRVRPKIDLVGMEIPGGTATITGIASQFNSDRQLLIRGKSDLLVSLSVTNLQQTNVFSTRFDVSWNTNVKASTILKWGKTPELENPPIEIAESANAHMVSLTNLEPASLYYIVATSVNGEGKIASSSRTVFATKSESTGEIKVFFNHPVDVSLKTTQEAVYVDKTMADTIAKHVDLANITLEIAVYNTNTGGAKIIQAINNAYDRGVKVRFIADAETANLGLANLNPNISILKDNGTGIMHNKFVVIDAESVLNSWVLTGSSNYTNNNLEEDYNNFVFIQDQTMARAYRAEFEEMWGGQGIKPNIPTIKFGAAKTRNTPNKVYVNDKLIELYFSPSDGTSQAIVNSIKSVNSDLRFALLNLTYDNISNEIINTYKAGWAVRGIISDPTVTGDDSKKLLELQGMANYLYYADPTNDPAVADLHHKYGIIDANNADSDPMVITGSHNWSSSAETINDENTLIIHDANIANQYAQEFGQRYFDFSGKKDAILLGVEDFSPENGTNLYPNPSKGAFKVQLAQELGNRAEIVVQDFTGRSILQTAYTNIHAPLEINTTNLQAGIYLVTIQTEKYRIVKKLFITQ